MEEISRWRIQEFNGVVYRSGSKEIRVEYQDENELEWENKKQDARKCLIK